MKKQLTSLAVLVIGFVIGSSALTAIAQAVPGWNPAPANPPQNNVSAPINTGATAQVKTGLLTLANFMFNPTGTPTVTKGNVLAAKDTNGTVEWQKQGFDFSGAGTVMNVSIPVAGNVVHPRIANPAAKGVVFNINKGNNECRDQMIELYSKAGSLANGTTYRYPNESGVQTQYQYLGYIFAGARDATVRQTGDVVTMPASNGYIMLKGAGSFSSVCDVTITKIADIY